MRYPAMLLFILALVTSPQPARAQQSDEAAWLLAQINALRQRNGAVPLTVNPQLTASATAHSTYLASHPYLNPHLELDGSTPQSRALAAGYLGRLVGENVVGGTSANVQWAFNWWVASPIHYTNMLAGWSEIGIGIVDGPYGRWYTTDFGDQGAGLVAPTAPPDSAADGSTPAKAAPPRTRRPPTRAPTLTPTITYTPSVTYTPRSTFTPTFTPTGPPPTGTPIVLEVSPQPVDARDNTAQIAVALAPTVTFTPLAVAMAASSEGLTPAPRPGTSDPIRTLIPWVIVLQFIVVGGLIASSVIRRQKR